MEDNKRNNQNPYNNPLLQALLDVKRLLWDEGLDRYTLTYSEGTLWMLYIQHLGKIYPHV